MVPTEYAAQARVLKLSFNGTSNPGLAARLRRTGLVMSLFASGVLMMMRALINTSLSSSVGLIPGKNEAIGVVLKQKEVLWQSLVLHSALGITCVAFRVCMIWCK